MGTSKGLGTTYNNLGLIHSYLGHYPLALENYLMAEKYFEEINN